MQRELEVSLLAFTVVNLIANISYAKVACTAAAISHKSHFLCFDSIFFLPALCHQFVT